MKLLQPWTAVLAFGVYLATSGCVRPPQQIPAPVPADTSELGRAAYMATVRLAQHALLESEGPVIIIDGAVADSSPAYEQYLSSISSTGIASVMFSAGSAGFDETVIEFRTILTVPWFPWPPPFPSGMTQITDSTIQAAVGDVATFGAVDAWLAQALLIAGYPERTYYKVPGGFAVVTRIERFSDGGGVLDPEQRWEMEVRTPSARFDIRSLLRSLLQAPTGRFRTIVFIVSDESFYSTERTSFEEVVDWSKNGANTLPTHMRDHQYTSEHEITVLVYEFTRTDVVVDPSVKVPGSLPATIHLEQSGILDALRGGH